eukprot:gb/GFBE01027102.1/.p1 GENE.gb/GFBE01027102.1/~~gb/GFBE01027102.1/.p1  ORF type:complete len:313 (+),score=80.22 gb/GFBE01027102.1/:1-939(+)
MASKPPSPQQTLARKLCWAAAALASLLVVALLLIYSAPAVPKASGGVHYGAKTLASGSGNHEPVMTGAPGGLHYMIRGSAVGPAPALVPMTAGYKEAAELASDDLLFVKWLVAAGDIVQAGDPLMVYSKDGVEQRLKASSSGQVKELVEAAEGEQLRRGSKLVIFGHPPPQVSISGGVMFLVALSMMAVAVLLVAGAVLLSTDSSKYKKLAPNERDHEAAVDELQTPCLAVESGTAAPAAASLPGLPVAYAPAPAAFSVAAQRPALRVITAPAESAPEMQPSQAVEQPEAQDESKKSDDLSPKLPRLSSKGR